MNKRSRFMSAVALAVVIAACGDDDDGQGAGGAAGAGAGGSAGAPGPITPACTEPAPLTPPNADGPRFIVSLDDATADVDARVDELEAKYSFTASTRFVTFKQFVSDLNAGQVAALRCEEDVQAIGEDQAIGVD